MAVRIGSEKKVMMVSSTATPAEVLKIVTAAVFMLIFLLIYVLRASLAPKHPFWGA